MAMSQILRVPFTMGAEFGLRRELIEVLQELEHRRVRGDTSGEWRGVVKLKRKKKKNLFEVAQFLPNWGIGYHMAKTHWRGVTYEITKINLYKDGRHGKAWGVAFKDGVPASDEPKKISGVHKDAGNTFPI